MAEHTKYTLDQSRLPEAWYNIVADLPTPPPPRHPGTGEPLGPGDLAPLFPMALIEQEVSAERFIAIPEEVRAAYRLWRPTPLYRAHQLERALGTPRASSTSTRGSALPGATSPTPLMAMHTLGHNFVPAETHAGGLRYHGMIPLVSRLLQPEADRGPCLPAANMLRGGGAVRAERGDHPGPGAYLRDPRHHRRGAALQGGGRLTHYPLQYGSIRQLPLGADGGL